MFFYIIYINFQIKKQHLSITARYLWDILIGDSFFLNEIELPLFRTNSISSDERESNNNNTSIKTQFSFSEKSIQVKPKNISNCI